MHRFPVGQEHDPEVTLLLRHENPSTHAAVHLVELGDRVVDRRFDPLVEDPCPVGRRRTWRKYSVVFNSIECQAGCITPAILLRRDQIVCGSRAARAGHPGSPRRLQQLLVGPRAPKLRTRSWQYAEGADAPRPRLPHRYPCAAILTDRAFIELCTRVDHRNVGAKESDAGHREADPTGRRPSCPVALRGRQNRRSTRCYRAVDDDEIGVLGIERTDGGSVTGVECGRERANLTAEHGVVSGAALRSGWKSDCEGGYHE